MVGHVTAVIRPIRRVAWASAPNTDQASGAWPLLFEPGKEVIGNGREVETRLLGTLRIAYQVGGAVLLGHELVAELEHC